MFSKLLASLVLFISVNAVAGNGAPSGAHFSLNIIGVPKGKSASMTNTSGHSIFVPMAGSTKINLIEGDTFKVLDRNGTDGSASFQMPSPDPDNDGLTEYSVFVRALGKPGGEARITTCAIDPLTLEEVCSTLNVLAVRSSGPSKFTNVSKELLYVHVDLDGDGTIERVPLFDDRLQDYYWQYDNNGLKLLQMRFYEIVTNVN